MSQPDPVAMLVGAVLFLAVVVVLVGVTAVRRRAERRLDIVRPESAPARDRKFAG